MARLLSRGEPGDRGGQVTTMKPVSASMLPGRDKMARIERPV
jgi:hypothetical protein